MGEIRNGDQKVRKYLFPEIFYGVRKFTNIFVLLLILMVVVVFFTLTDRASAIPSNIRGCQSGTWSAGQKEIRGTSTKLHWEQKKNTNTQKTTKRKEQE